MSTISEFLLARVSEDERFVQREAAHPHPADRSRVLAECEAKRHIAAWAWDNEEVLEGEWGNGRDREELERAGVLPDPLRHLATVYADHPDFREEWRP